MTLFGWAGLTGTTFVAALLQAISGFGFAVLAVPLYLLFVDSAQSVQLAIILSTVRLSLAVVSELRRTVDPALLLRLSAGSRRVTDRAVFVPARRPVASPSGSWSHDPRQDADSRSRRRGRRGRCDRVGRDGRAAGADLSVAGRDGGANRARDAVRILCAVIPGTVASHAATAGIPGPTWVAAGILVPFALLCGFTGRPIGDRIGSGGFAILAIALLTVAGLYTVAAAGVGLVTRQP